MGIKQIAKIVGGQDGAIYKNELFRFNAKGECCVFNLTDLDKKNMGELIPFATFTLDKTDLIVPHSNSVCFGVECFVKRKSCKWY